MDIRTATVSRIALLKGTSAEEAKYILAELFEAGYRDTDDVDEDAWQRMIRSARAEAESFGDPETDDEA